MATGVEEEELCLVRTRDLEECWQKYLGDNEGLDKHYYTACNNGCKCNYVQTTQDIKNDVAWSSQMLG